MLTLLFDSVHGITLAFGFTLLGVAIDYPLHLFTHADKGSAAGNRGVWRVLILGIASTLIAYGAFILSGTVGLRQLGVFAFSGIVAAAAIAAWLAAPALGAGVRADPATPDAASQQFRYVPALVVLCGAVAVLSTGRVFNDDLSSLTPVEADLLAADAQVRMRLGVADIRHLVSVRGSDQQETLARTERALDQLAPLLDDDQLGGVQTVVQILPSLALQAQRRERMQDSVLEAFDAAMAELPLDAEAFGPFVRDFEITRGSGEVLTLAALRQDDRLRGAVDNLFFHDSRSWVSLIFLKGLGQPEAVPARLASVPGTQLVDLKLTSERMVSDYRTDLLQVLLFALALIGLLLALRLDTRRAVWLVLNVSAAVAFARRL